MESLNVPQRSSNLSQESDGPSGDDRDISPTRKHHKAKQKRKASTISLRDNGKTKNRTGKGRQSLAQTKQEMGEVLSFMKTYNFKSSNVDPLKTFDELIDEQDDDDTDQAALYLRQLTIDEKNITQRLQRNGATNLAKNRFRAAGLGLAFKTRISRSQDPQQKNVPLEDRLAHDKEFEVTGIMNLSEMNVTDNDIPVIIQHAFWRGRKKCTGLILRDNFITSAGVKMIIDAVLMARSDLRYLSFSNNADIGDAGVEHLVRLLQNSRSIIFLSLPHTGVTNRSVRLLADALCGVDAGLSSSPPTLEKLFLSCNKLVTDESLDALLQILEQNQSLKALSVEHCSLSEKARKQLRQVGLTTKKKKFSLSE